MPSSTHYFQQLVFHLFWFEFVPPYKIRLFYNSWLDIAIEIFTLQSDSYDEPGLKVNFKPILPKTGLLGIIQNQINENHLFNQERYIINVNRYFHFIIRTAVSANN